MQLQNLQKTRPSYKSLQESIVTRPALGLGFSNRLLWYISMHAHAIIFTFTLALILSSCGGRTTNPPSTTSTLVINEVVSSNDGVSIDEIGQTGDWLELANTGTTPLELKNYSIADGAGVFANLPAITWAP
jgi:hypothetical protein